MVLLIANYLLMNMDLMYYLYLCLCQDDEDLSIIMAMILCSLFLILLAANLLLINGRLILCYRTDCLEGVLMSFLLKIL
jgi:hypothetical protein